MIFILLENKFFSIYSICYFFIYVLIFNSNIF